MDRDIEPIAIAFHAAWGKHAPWTVLATSSKWRYRKAAEDFLKELAKVGLSVTNGVRNNDQ